MKPRIGILGGTLDPVHAGHVETARAACTALALERVLIVPTGTPPHRPPPQASRFHRFAMAALAVTGESWLEVSDLEIGEEAASYTYDTLVRLHARGLSALQIFFITGADAFAEIATWSRYPQVLDLSNFVVVSRPGHPATQLPAKLPAIAARMTAADGAPRASTETRVYLVDAATPDVSSSGIRQRLAAGESIAGLVPEPVKAYIEQHHLYVRPDVQAPGRSLA